MKTFCRREVWCLSRGTALTVIALKDDRVLSLLRKRQVFQIGPPHLWEQVVFRDLLSGGCFCRPNTQNPFLQCKDKVASIREYLLFERNSCYGKSIFKMDFWKCFPFMWLFFFFFTKKCYLSTKYFICIFEILEAKFSFFFLNLPKNFWEFMCLKTVVKHCTFRRFCRKAQLSWKLTQSFDQNLSTSGGCAWKIGIIIDEILPYCASSNGVYISLWGVCSYGSP